MPYKTIFGAQSVTSLQTTRFDRTIRATVGTVCVVMDDEVVMLEAGKDLCISRGIMYAIANLTSSSVVISDSISPAVLLCESTVFAEQGKVYATHRGALAQVTLNLYQGLHDRLGDVIPEPYLLAA